MKYVAITIVIMGGIISILLEIGKLILWVIINKEFVKKMLAVREQIDGAKTEDEKQKAALALHNLISTL